MMGKKVVRERALDNGRAVSREPPDAKTRAPIRSAAGRA